MSGSKDKAHEKRSWTPPLQDLEEEAEREINRINHLIAEEIVRKTPESNIDDATRIRLLEEEIGMLKVQLGLSIHEKQRMTKKYENCKFVLHDSASKQDSLKKKISKLEQKISNVEWPNKVRAAIFDIEGDLNMSILIVCFQCGIVHTPLCQYDKTTAKYPSEPKGQRIFLRRQRWNYVLISVLKNSGAFDNPRIKKIIFNLKTKFDQIHAVSTAGNLNDSEKFIRDLKTFEEVIFWFCQAVADIFEELSQMLKVGGSTGEIENLGIFNSPYDLLATVLVNSSVIFNSAGKVTFTPFSPVFMPKN